MSTKTLKIFRQHLPTVDAGKYSIKVTAESNLIQDSIESTEIVVKNYLHHIPDHEILTLYPNKSTEGNFAGVIPHIEFKRSTLPWELKVSNAQNRNRLPYIFLLILKESELAIEPSAPDALHKAKIQNIPIEKLENAISDLQVDSFRTLKIPHRLLNMLPQANDLANLAFVKDNADLELEQLGIPKQTSVLLANRILYPNTKYHAFICSFAKVQQEQYHIPDTLGNTNYLDLIILNEWTFSSTSNTAYMVDEARLQGAIEGVTFDANALHPIFYSEQEIVQYINRFPSRFQKLITILNNRSNLAEMNRFKLLELLQSEGKTLKNMLKDLSFGSWKSNHKYQTGSHLNKLKQLGKVPLEHQLKAGGKIISWYQSPFTHYNNRFRHANQQATLKEDIDTFIDRVSSNVNLPDHAEKLIWYNAQSQMLDMSYASAFQLGRLLMLNDFKALQELKQWKTKIRQHNIVQKQNRQNHILQISLTTGIEKIPNELYRFIKQVLYFENIPYYYLVPHESLLPIESVRYFKLENCWIVAVLLGAFSLGQAYTVKDFKEKILNNLLIKSIFNYGEDYYGMIWNSKIPAYFPQIKTSYNQHIMFDRVHKLNEQVRLCIAKHQIHKINMFMDNEHMNFGIPFEGNMTVDTYRTRTLSNSSVTAEFTGSLNISPTIPFGLLNKPPFMNLIITINPIQQEREIIEDPRLNLSNQK